MKSRVRIVQLLCPERHCLCAAAYLSADGSAIPQKAFELRANMETYGMETVCGICRSRDLVMEDSATRYRTMAEAGPALRQCEADQAATRDYYNFTQNRN